MVLNGPLSVELYVAPTSYSAAGAWFSRPDVSAPRLSLAAASQTDCRPPATAVLVCFGDWVHGE
jgi:hypothetical protein